MHMLYVHACMHKKIYNYTYNVMQIIILCMSMHACNHTQLCLQRHDFAEFFNWQRPPCMKCSILPNDLQCDVNAHYRVADSYNHARQL